MAAAREQDKTLLQSGAVLDWEAWDGTLPPPETLQQYEELMPGGARLILALLESEQAYRWKRAAAAQEQELELRRLELETERQDEDYGARIAYFTLVAAAIILLASTAGSIYLIAINHGWAGLGLAASGAAFAFVILAGSSRFRPFRRWRGSQSGELA